MKFLLALVVIVLSAARPTVPTLKWVTGSSYKACNPLLSDVSMEIDCGASYERVAVRLSAGTCEDLVLTTNVKGDPAPICALAGWRRVK